MSTIFNLQSGEIVVVGNISYEFFSNNYDVAQLGFTEKNFDIDTETLSFDSGEIVAGKKPTPPIDILFYARELRQPLLSGSDYTQTVDAPITNEKKLEWQSYRQKLRDFPADVQSRAYTTKKEILEFLPSPPE